MPGTLSLTPTRRALLALALGGFGIGTGEFVTLGLLPNIADSLHVSIPKAGELVSAYALGVVIGAPLLTGAAVRLPRKGLLIGVALLMALLNLASAVMPGYGTLLIMRFLTGLPHGAYFGVATVVAGNLVTEDRRSRAMAMVFAGLTLANVIGVPMTTLIGQHSSWRVCYALVGVIEIAAAGAVTVFVPLVNRDEAAPPRLSHELRAFRQPQVWLSLGVATIGGGALFAVVSYIAPLITHVAGFSSGAITPLLVLLGLGMTAGNLLGAHLADRALMRTMYLALICETIISVVFFFSARTEITAAITIFLFPVCSFALVAPVQSRLVSLAGGAPNLAAASMQAAFNVANSIGAWLGGAVIAAGLGYAAPTLVAAGLALVGLAIALVAGRLERKGRSAAEAPAAEIKVLVDC
jgi:DHA1 family inner membrane transport protein